MRPASTAAAIIDLAASRSGTGTYRERQGETRDFRCADFGRALAEATQGDGVYASEGRGEADGRRGAVLNHAEGVLLGPERGSAAKRIESSGGRLKLPLVGARHVAHARPGTQTELNKACCKIEGGGASQVGRRRAKPLDAFRAIEPDRQVDTVVAAHGEQTNVGALLVERQAAAAVDDEAELRRQAQSSDRCESAVSRDSTSGRGSNNSLCVDAGERAREDIADRLGSAVSSSRSCSASADHRAGKLSASTPRI